MFPVAADGVMCVVGDVHGGSGMDILIFIGAKHGLWDHDDTGSSLWYTYCTGYPRAHAGMQHGGFRVLIRLKRLQQTRTHNPGNLSSLAVSETHTTPPTPPRPTAVSPDDKHT